VPTDLQSAALEYLRAGLHILALTGKKPNGRVHGDGWSWEDSFYGAPETDAEVEAVLAAFSEDEGTSGIAILIPEHFLVADVDTERAADLLISLGYETNDETIAAQTKNGIHLWFYAPGADGNRWLGDGQEPNPTRTLLFKGLGGYVVAPPSEHHDAGGAQDGTYEWIIPLVVDDIAQMPQDLPAGVRDRLKAGEQYAAAKPPKEAMTSFTATPVEGLKWWQWPQEFDYNTAGLERAIETAADGNQNNVIHWAAMTCREEGVPFEVAMERLTAAAERGHHPRNRARDTIRGAYKRGPRG
jgi:hypothetical protein